MVAIYSAFSKCIVCPLSAFCGLRRKVFTERVYSVQRVSYTPGFSFGFCCSDVPIILLSFWCIVVVSSVAF